MDWEAIANILAERCDQPVALLDKEGRIRMLNSVMGQVLELTRFQVEGQPWAQACTPTELHAETRRWIDEALRGALRTYEVVGLARSGERIAFLFEFLLVGQGPIQGLLMTATRAVPQAAAAAPIGALGGQEVDYEVASDGTEFGVLSRIVANGSSIRIDLATARCFAVIHGAQQPCPDCPLLRDAALPWPRISVRHGQGSGPVRAFKITTAEKLADRVRLRLRLLPEHTLEAIHAAKIEDLARQAALSPREREVLSYLLLGRDLKSIAALMGIAVRTVKYHQVHVLQKLGADSRADLMRVLL